MKLAMFDLSGKVAIVTGGYSGLGYASAEALAEAGAQIVIGARHLDRCQEACSKIEKLGVKCLPFRCDVTDEQDVDTLFEVAVREFGKVDILLNSAGTFGEGKPIAKTDTEDWGRTLDVDSKGTFLCCRAAAREMMKRNEGKIINIASVSAFKAVFGMGSYSAAKAAVVMLTKTLALELAPYNIQANVISPGYILTPLNKSFFDSPAGARVMAKWPTERIGSPDLLKGIVLYLASPASNYMTGSEIVIDDGQSLS